MLKLYHGDCLEIIRKIPDGSVDLVFTDPPYGHNNNAGDLIQAREAALGEGKKIPRRSEVASSWERVMGKGLPGEARPILNDGVEAHELLQKILPEVKRVLVPGGVFCCCCGGGGSHSRTESPYEPTYAWWSIWIDKVLRFKQMVVWDKGPMGMGWHYRRSYEVILVAEKPGASCNWYDKTNQIENIIRPGSNGISKIIPGKDNHPTQKPVGLAAHFIKLHTRKGDTVLDPFMGHGTTAEAALLAGRSFIGIELDPTFYEKCKAKLKPMVHQGFLTRQNGDRDEDKRKVRKERRSKKKKRSNRKAAGVDPPIDER